MASSGGFPRRIVDVLVVLTLVVLVYLGYHVVPAYFDHYQMKNKIHEVMVAVSRTTAQRELKRSVRDVIKEFHPDVDDDDIVTGFEDRIFTIHYEYVKVIPIPLLDKEIEMDFEVDDQKDTRIW